MTDYEKLLHYALRILSKKRYTVLEMRKKLKYIIKKNTRITDKPESATTLIDLVIERVLELKYLNDEVYLEDYIRDRVNFKPRGKLLLMKELQLKGLEKNLITEALQNQNINEFDMALGLLEKKKQSWEKYSEEKRRNKAFLYLESKGFGQDPIYKAINCCYSAIRE